MRCCICATCGHSSSVEPAFSRRATERAVERGGGQSAGKVSVGRTERLVRALRRDRRRHWAVEAEAAVRGTLRWHGQQRLAAASHTAPPRSGRAPRPRPGRPFAHPTAGPGDSSTPGRRGRGVGVGWGARVWGRGGGLRAPAPGARPIRAEVLLGGVVPVALVLLRGRPWDGARRWPRRHPRAPRGVPRRRGRAAAAREADAPALLALLHQKVCRAPGTSVVFYVAGSVRLPALTGQLYFLDNERRGAEKWAGCHKAVSSTVSPS